MAASRVRRSIRGCGCTSATAELGEPMLCELKLENVSNQPVSVYGLQPSEGFVQIAVTSPSGVRRPVLPIDETRRNTTPVTLQPGQSIYEAVDITMGIYGFAFKEPGPYRIEASFANIDGRTAALPIFWTWRMPSRW